MTRAFGAARPRPARGLTLVELMVAVAISAIVIAAAVALLLSTQRSFQSGVDDRAMQETARVALDELTNRLRAAGYGLEPTFVFDFGQAPTVMDRGPAGTTVNFGGYQCPTAVTCRDRTDGPDELVFYARDPDFGYDLAPFGNGEGQLVLTNPNPKPNPNYTTVSLQPGQVLQVMCYGTNNTWLWSYVTVASAVSSSDAQVAVPLSPKSDTFDFPLQNGLLSDPCFGSGLRRAFKIDRYRYYVQAVDAAGNPQPWETAGTRPYLMLDQGIGNPVAVAPDVEDLQVSYVFPLSTDPAAQLVGHTSGTAITPDANGIDLAPALGIPGFSTPSQDPTRTTHHPANIRAVRVAITVRSPRQDAHVTDATVPAAGNRPDLAGESGYHRLVFEVTTRVPNMENRLALFPVYFGDSGFPNSNVGGG